MQRAVKGVKVCTAFILLDIITFILVLVWIVPGKSMWQLAPVLIFGAFLVGVLTLGIRDAILFFKNRAELREQQAREAAGWGKLESKHQ